MWSLPRSQPWHGDAHAQRAARAQRSKAKDRWTARPAAVLLWRLQVPSPRWISTWSNRKLKESAALGTCHFIDFLRAVAMGVKHGRPWSFVLTCRPSWCHVPGPESRVASPPILPNTSQGFHLAILRGLLKPGKALRHKVYVYSSADRL